MLKVEPFLIDDCVLISQPYLTDRPLIGKIVWHYPELNVLGMRELREHWCIAALNSTHFVNLPNQPLPSPIVSPFGLKTCEYLERFQKCLLYLTN